MANITLPIYRVGRNTVTFIIEGLVANMVSGGYAGSSAPDTANGPWNVTGRFESASFGLERQHVTKQSADAGLPTIIPYGDEGSFELHEMELIAPLSANAADRVNLSRLLWYSYDYVRITMDVQASGATTATTDFATPTQITTYGQTDRIQIVAAITKVEVDTEVQKGDAKLSCKLTAAYDSSGNQVSVWI